MNLPTTATSSSGPAAVLSRFDSRRRRAWLAATAALSAVVLVGPVGLAGCAATGPAPPTLFEPRALSLADLDAELRRELKGTPVQISATAASSQSPALLIAVPQPHGFEVGSAAVKPALAAVLDRLVAGLKGNPRWLIQVSAPFDPRSGSFQGQDRASAVRDYLVVRGVAAPRFEPPRGNAGSATEITVIDRPVRP